jgi:hypothetical protein
VANKFLKPTVIARATVGLLYRELVVARTLWTDAVDPGEFTGALNDTVTMRVPARRTARKRTLRAGTAIVNDTTNEFGVPVQLTTDIYNGAPITDEELTLDITDFAGQVLTPQVRAVVEGLEDEAVTIIEDATYPARLIVDPSDTEFQVAGETDWYRVAARAAKLLDKELVPESGRTLLVGANVKEEIVTSDRFSRYDAIGPDNTDALRERIIGRIAGFDVIATTSIDDDDAFAYHRTAFVLATRAPRVPQGATFGQLRAAGGAAQGAPQFYNGISVRWLMDYDYTNTTDRSLVNTWTGTAVVKDPIDVTNVNSAMELRRAVKITSGS